MGKYDYYTKELEVIKKSNRFRTRKLYDNDLIDFASNDYLGLGNKKKLFKKAYKLLQKEDHFSPKSSLLVNGYHPIHQKFEKLLANTNRFEKAIVIGSGFLANISLIEGLVRKKDILFIDEEYHASGMVTTKLVDNVAPFLHNNYSDLEEKIKNFRAINKNGRIIIAIEGVYSMGGDIAPKEFVLLAEQYNALLIVDEAHSSGVIGDNLLGWYDYHNIKIQPNHIKMGTLGKAYGSYGAYILASNHIITFLENRAKAIIYTTAPSLFDVTLGYVALQYIIKHKAKLLKKIALRTQIVEDILDITPSSLILPIIINDNQKVLDIQTKLAHRGFAIGAIRQPTVQKAILRVILKLDIKQKKLHKLLQLIKNELKN